MHNQIDVLQRQKQSQVERLFARGGAQPVPVPEPPPAPADEVNPTTADEQDLVRRSYCILRGRLESLPSLELRNQRGQIRLMPWSYFGGASLDHPGELVLFFDGPEGTCQVTVTGLGLDQELLEGVQMQKVVWIGELDELGAADVRRKDPAEPVVTRISIKGGREWSRAGAARPGS